MQIIPLYKYTRVDSGVTVSPSMPDCEYTEMFRLIADEGKVLTKNGIDAFPCKDTDNTDGWYEIDEPVKVEDEVADMRAALDVLGVEP